MSKAMLSLKSIVLVAMSGSMILMSGCWNGFEEYEPTVEDEQVVVSEDVVAEEEPPPPKPVSPYVGKWKISELQGIPLDVILLEDGTAISNWTDGEHGVEGEKGTWYEEDGRVVITYENGWKDVIHKEDDDVYTRSSYSPETPVHTEPNSVGPVQRIEKEPARFVGVWEGKDKDGTPLFFIAMKSDGTAKKSNNPHAHGQWMVSDDASHAQIEWSDGTFNLIQPTETETLIEIWRPDTPREEKPDSVWPISEVGSGER